MITIWRFNSAPPQLRSLYKGAGEPEWVMQVPRSLAKDVKKYLATAWREYSHEETMIYFGAALPVGFLMSEAELSQGDGRKMQRLVGGSPVASARKSRAKVTPLRHAGNARAALPPGPARLRRPSIP